MAQVAQVIWIAAFAALGLLAAWWLAGTLGFPGSELPTDVVGALSYRGADKGVETRMFVFSVALVPAFAWFAAWLWRRATGSIAAWARRRLQGSSVFPRAARTPWGDLLLGPYAELVFAAAAVTVALLVCGPRSIPNSPLAPTMVRIAGLFAGSVGVIAGICTLLAPAAGLRRFELARPWILVMGARLVPTHLATPIALGLAATALVIAVWNARVLRRVESVEAAPARRSRFAWGVAAPLLVFVLVFNTTVHGGVDLFHAGEWLTIGAAVKAGAVPFRDLYLQHGLVQNALRPEWTMTWLGDSLWADRIADHALYAATAAVFFALLLGLLRSPYVALLGALTFATEGLYLQYRFIPLFVTMACLLRHLARSRNADGSVAAAFRPGRWLVAAGASSGVGLFWSLDVGAYSTLASMLFVLADAWVGRVRAAVLPAALACAIRFGAGIAIGALPFVVYLGANGALAAFVENSMRQVALQIPVWGLPFPSLHAWLGDLRKQPLADALGSGVFIAFVAPLVFVGTLAGLLVRSMRRPPSRRALEILLLCVFGLVVYRTALGRSDAGHFAYAAALFWPLALVLAEEAWCARASIHRALRVLPALMLVAFLLTAFHPAYGLVRQWSRLSDLAPDLPGSGFSYAPLRRMRDVLVPDSQAHTLTALKAWLDEHLPPGEPFADMCNAGAAYYFVERPIASRYAFPAYAATPAMQDEYISDLERTRPKFLMVSKTVGEWHVDLVPLELRLPKISRYLKARYEHFADDVFGTMLIRLDA